MLRDEVRPARAPDRPNQSRKPHHTYKGISLGGVIVVPKVLLHELARTAARPKLLIRIPHSSFPHSQGHRTARPQDRGATRPQTASPGQ